MGISGSCGENKGLVKDDSAIVLLIDKRQTTVILHNAVTTEASSNLTEDPV